MKKINEILGMKYPIIQGAMANIATGEFAAACSNAGAFGIVAVGGLPPEKFEEEIIKCKKLTDRPFGVNIMLMHPQADDIADIIARNPVAAVTTGAGNPGRPPGNPGRRQKGTDLFRKNGQAAGFRFHPCP